MESASGTGRMALGLLGLSAAAWLVLRAGEDLSAPPPLGPDWQRPQGEACAPEARTLTLGQSGVFLELRWPGGPAPVLHGRLDGESIALTGAVSGCGAGEARLAGTWGPEGLSARLDAPGCGACDGAAIRAIRTAATTRTPP